jgi:hypothetical protein
VKSVRALRELAERTPGHRERHVDLLRALAIGAVVVGHWLAVVLVVENGELSGYNALELLAWTHPLTWLFQVMPLFFMVGGFANAASLTAYRRRGEGDAAWLLSRAHRLIRPTSALLLVLAGAALVARTAGVDGQLVGTAVWLASLPLWFLAAYLGMVVLTPPMHALHRRAGLVVPAVLVGLVVAADVVRSTDIGGLGFLGYANFALGWLAIHQIGFAWQDGRLPARPRLGAPVLAGGLVTLIGLTVLGPYPVSMVNVPGESVQNAAPPTVALLALATAQLGLALLLRDPSERWLRRSGPWTAVVAVNAVVLTVFLWHFTAVVIAAVALYLTGLIPDLPAGSPGWLLWQLPWIALLALLLAALVATFGRIEVGGGRPSERPRWLPPAGADVLMSRWPRAVATAAGFTAVIAGLIGIAVSGPDDHGPFGLPSAPLIGYLAGAALLRVAGIAMARQQDPARR